MMMMMLNAVIVDDDKGVDNDHALKNEYDHRFDHDGCSVSLGIELSHEH